MTNMDDEIYAYEQEMNEEDEWEAMHAHEMEAAEEALREMDEAAMEAERDQRDSRPQQPPVDDALPDAHNGGDDEDEDSLDPNERIARVQSRLNRVLERCANLLGESESRSSNTQQLPGHSEVLPDTEVIVDDRNGLLAKQQQKQKFHEILDGQTKEFLHSRPPIDVDSMPLVLSGGDRMFFRKRTSPLDVERPKHAAAAVDINTLLPVSVEMMMMNIEQRQIELAMEKDDVPALEIPRPAAARTDRGVLWLDKYRPERFMDLLSDERTNREVLLWMKRWDSFVFPHKNSSVSTRQSPTGTPTTKSGAFTSKLVTRPAAEQETEDPRPAEKIILICGPPGAGKTTLANIVARHAGYNPIEINASDDRTPGVLKNRIISAMEMQSIWGDRKPNCIILDEIDGAMSGGDGKTAIHAIQEIVQAPLHQKRTGKSGGNTNHHPLTRPIICICNDQYAAVLRPLRKLAKIFVLDTPNQQRLISRLKVICRQEGLKVNTGVLAELCTAGVNDIRYCVNVLQFQQSSNKTLQRGALLNGEGGFLGQKDAAHGLSDLAELVFFEPKNQKGSPSPSRKRALIGEAARAVGNNQLLLQALDENLPQMVFNDPTLTKMCDAFEWLGTADHWDTRARTSAQFAFASYVSFAALAVHDACCMSTRRRIEYPRASSEFQRLQDKSTNILQALLDNCRLHASFQLSYGVLSVDVIPWLLGVLSPNVRRHNSSTQTPDERAIMKHLIQLMAELGLAFRPKFQFDGSEDYVLEPPVHELVVFKKSERDRPGATLLPLTVRKMIAREVELETMRKTELSSAPRPVGKAKESAAAVTTNGATPARPIPPLLSEEEEQRQLEALRRRNPFAFAYREAKRKRHAEEKEQERAAKRANGTGGDDDGAPDKTVRYKFNEGYTCGIKTAVYVRDLL
ncbi:TPA: hypothetical protein N0F65_008477 [Lagenidium giganteum]|uniref:AAA+ ATPase domain-containing protein n=1 Tax=Lagenidium giganteum TaxID=4803 RepID=A0AAV2Z426_9STRA|nr:TPA: hypothetical protein N0F65_008477 [Lagenidium giganteum]